jgi:hypothetical protein
LLRLGLRSNGSAPWHYVDFLDDAAARLFLRKVGGGYIFIHRLLQDYLAARYTDSGVVTEPSVKILPRPSGEQLHVASKPPPRPKWQERIGFGVILLIILAVPLGLLSYGLFRGKSIVEQAVTQMGNRLAATPEFQAATAGLSKTEVEAVVQDAARKGLSRLGDASLLARTAIMEEVLTVVDSATCSAIARGTVTPAQLFEVLAKLDAATMNAWMALWGEAVLSELRKHPLPQTIEDSVVSTSFEVLVDTLPPDQGERLLSIWNDDSQASDEDRCWAARTFHKTLNSLGEPHRSTLARAVVQ